MTPIETPPLASVVVLNWNRKALTACCLQSLRAQTLTDKDVILVDNGSRDGSAAELAKAFPEVRLVALPDNRGFCGGNNAGIRASHSPYVALLNNDAQAEPGWLAALVGALQINTRAGLAASKIVLHDQPQLLDTAGDLYTVAGAAAKRGHRQRADLPEFNAPGPVFGACAGAALYRRRMLDEIGLLDEDFFIAQEDVDLSFRARLAGYGCLYVPGAVARHRLNATLQAHSEDYVYYGHRNLEFVYLKNMPGPLLALTLPLHLADVLLSGAYHALRGRGGAFWRAKRDALRGLRCVWRKRVAIQQKRRISIPALWSSLDKRWLRLKLIRWLQRP